MKTVTLTTPLLGGKVTSFGFREPKLADFLTLGDPRSPIFYGDDQVYMRPVPEVVKLYAERLLVDGDLNIMEGASLRDAIEIQKVVLGFFLDAMSPIETGTPTSPGSPDGSPSTPSKTSTASEG